jgi:hypothetical protein
VAIGYIVNALSQLFPKKKGGMGKLVVVFGLSVTARVLALRWLFAGEVLVIFAKGTVAPAGLAPACQQYDQ